ncbi:inorganic diphosphatase [soil metagenome]
MHPLHDLTPGPNPPLEINCLVEIPKGSRNKYELDKKTGMFKLDRTLYSPMIYPGDYGLVPQTHYDDGDPLDVLILANEPTFTGCIVEVRPIGIFRMLDKGDHDDKILAVPVGNPYFRNFHDLIDVPPHFLEEVGHFFQVYKDLEGSRTQPLGWESVEVARKRITHAIRLYKELMHKEAMAKIGEKAGMGNGE